MAVVTLDGRLQDAFFIYSFLGCGSYSVVYSAISLLPPPVLPLKRRLALKVFIPHSDMAHVFSEARLGRAIYFNKELRTCAVGSFAAFCFDMPGPFALAEEVPLCNDMPAEIRARLERVRSARSIYVTCSDVLDGPDLYGMLCSRAYVDLTFASADTFRRFVCCALAQVFACMHIIRYYFPGLKHRDLHSGNIFSISAAVHLIVYEVAPLVALVVPLAFTHCLELRIADFGGADAPSLGIRRPACFSPTDDRLALIGGELPDLVTRLASYRSVEQHRGFWKGVSDVLDSITPAASHAPDDENGFLRCLLDLGCFAWMRVDAREDSVDAWCAQHFVSYRSSLVRRVRLYH